MDTLFQNFVTSLLAYKYQALFLTTFVAGIGIPVPSTTILLTSAALASHKFLHVGWVIFWVATANILADFLVYWIARALGEQVFRIKRVARLRKTSGFTALSRILHEHANWLIFMSRFEWISTFAVNILAGLTKVPLRRFAFLMITGEIAYAGCFVAIGYFFGSNWENLTSIIGIYPTLLIIAAFIVWFSLHHRRK